MPTGLFLRLDSQALKKRLNKNDVNSFITRVIKTKKKWLQWNHRLLRAKMVQGVGHLIPSYTKGGLRTMWTLSVMEPPL